MRSSRRSLVVSIGIWMSDTRGFENSSRSASPYSMTYVGLNCATCTSIEGSASRTRARSSG
ncbi:MAG: hypothetical protein CMJ83_22975 [Planctomycetes bacterium]|nr:hypothetical protein [Planctomycetota bacterium]